jgi:hypothetical protein
MTLVRTSPNPGIKPPCGKLSLRSFSGRIVGMNEAAGAADAARGPTDGGGASRLEW